jgi:hypothetical protein
MLFTLQTVSSLTKIHCFCATCGKKIIYSHGLTPNPPTNLICRTCESKLINVTIDSQEYQLPSDIDPLILLRLFGKDPTEWKVSNFEFIEISSQKIENLSDRVTQDAQCDQCQVFLPTGTGFYCESHEEQELIDLCENCVKLHNGHKLCRFENVSCGFTDLWDGNLNTSDKVFKMPPSIWSDLNRIIRGLFTIRARGDADSVRIRIGESSLLIDPDSFDSLSDDESETRDFIVKFLKRLNRNWFQGSRRLSIVIQSIQEKKSIPLLPCWIYSETEKRENPIAEYRQELINDRKRSREMKEQKEHVEYAIPGGFTNDPIHAFERAMKKKI